MEVGGILIREKKKKTLFSLLTVKGKPTKIKVLFSRDKKRISLQLAHAVLCISLSIRPALQEQLVSEGWFFFCLGEDNIILLSLPSY